ncbi:glutamine synthetase family protein [Sinorhizobium sp. BG8]|uniref:glutamine synthetase family protein n=1 Tax=Sinorhizobium sp. BG8 TaxID=2613773 RepID=UPI00193D817B|nr:glutamine synthetase family protein [Sinorhizobium sp. BG8]QRM57666.1 glutamine synthetase [Sinorhizobium sp. BG8]
MLNVDLTTRERLEANISPEAEYVLAAICDMNGIFRGKRVPRNKLERVEADGIRMPMSSIGVDIWGTDVMGTQLTLERGDLDGICMPTGRAALDLGWGGQGSLVPMWMTKEDGTPYFADGRRLLADVLERYSRAGLTPVVATEVEFYLLDPAEALPAPARGGAASQPGEFDNIYSLDELNEFSSFFDDVYAMAKAAGISVEAAISEGAPRQFEFNLQHKPDALKIADDTLFFKQIMRNVAKRHGHLASFMAKPYKEHAGSGLHVHFSILDSNGANIFDNGTDLGSSAMRHAVGGLLDCMAEMTLVFAPHLNSYRRLAPGGLAPTTVAWGYENRTAAVRIPAGPHVARRIEHRVAGADANPYLVLAAILSGALDGIQRQAQPSEPVKSNSHQVDAPQLARDWRQALEWLRSSQNAGRLLYPEFVSAFSACKEQEQDVFASRMTDFEVATYRLSV